MLLDYERYQRRSPKKKSRIILFIFLLIAFGLGTYFLVSAFFHNRKSFEALTMPPPGDRLDELWARLVDVDRAPQQAGTSENEEKKILDELIRLSDDLLYNNPLSLKPLLYQGYASFYRGLCEPTFEKQLPYFNQSVISERRALLHAGQELKPQLCYMLGRVYFHKRASYYDLAARYLEQALKLGYKRLDAYEYLVLVYNEWGMTDQAIGHLEKAYAEKHDVLYLYSLAQSYQKVNRLAEARELLTRVKSEAQDAELLKECRFLLGEILFAQGNYRQAERQYRDILNDDTNSAEAHFRLALIYEKLGDYAQYRFELRLTLEEDRGHSGARSRL
ncbi:MAG: tetratricopeptide repeat protein [Spirochaetales bacterium]|nr:tetratricopeptide repeat protein [Spirochaetales bacterium]